MKKNVLVITGTRAEYGLLKPVLKEMARSKKLSPKLLVTGMHTLNKFGYTINEIKKDGFPIAAVIPVSEKDDMLKSLTKEILGIRIYLLRNKTDLILLLGDRDEMLAGAIVGGHLKIPIAHMGGGDVSGSTTVDEANRHSVTKFSHLHLTSNKTSYRRILQLGEESWRVFNVGVTAFDDLAEMKFLDKNEMAQKYRLNPSKPWLLIVHHPTPLENIPFLHQIHPLLKVVAKFNAEKIIVYPNSDTGSRVFIRAINRYKHKPHFTVLKNLPHKEFLNFIKTSTLMIGNSSSGIIESVYFKMPSVNVGSRQRGRERGTNVIDCNYDEKSVARAISKALSRGFTVKSKRAKNPYGSGNASKKIVRIIEKNINNPRLFLKSFRNFD